MKRHLALFMFLLLVPGGYRNLNAGFDQFLHHILHNIKGNWKPVTGIAATAGVVYTTYILQRALTNHNPHSSLHTLLCPACRSASQATPHVPAIADRPAQRPLTESELNEALQQPIIVETAPSSRLVTTPRNMPEILGAQAAPSTIPSIDDRQAAPSISPLSPAPALQDQELLSPDNDADAFDDAPAFNDPLLQAIAIGDNNTVTHMLETGQVDLTVQENGTNALDLAATTNNEYITNLILNYQDQLEHMTPQSTLMPQAGPSHANTVISTEEILQQKEYFFKRETNLAQALKFDDASRAQQRACELLASRTDINAVDDEGNSAFMVAACRGFTDIVRDLLNRGVDCYYRNPKTDANVLLHLIMNRAKKTSHIDYFNQNETLDILLTHCDVKKMLEASPKIGNALMLAVQTGEMELIQKIHRINPALIQQIDTCGQSALYYAMDHKQHEQIALWLVDNGADINLADRYGNTPLKVAVNKNATNVVKKLLQHNVVIDGAMYQELLERAAKKDSVGIVEALVLAYAPNTSAAARQAALSYSSLNHDSYIYQLLTLSPELYKNADFVWKIARQKNTADNDIVHAARENNVAAIQSARGQDVNEPSAWGLTPFMIASLLGHTQCMKALIAKGAQIDATIHTKTITELVGLLSQSGKLDINHAAVITDILLDLDQAQMIRHAAEKKEQEDKRNKAREAAQRRLRNK